MLFKRGAYNFASLAHDERDVARHRERGERGARRAARGARGWLIAVLAPLAGRTPLVDAHAHFYHPASGARDWQRVNAARFRAGERIGISAHVASILGSWGLTSPTYFPSPADVTAGNDAMLALRDASIRIACAAT